MSRRVHLQEGIVSRMKFAWPSPIRMALNSLKIQACRGCCNDTLGGWFLLLGDESCLLLKILDFYHRLAVIQAGPLCAGRHTWLEARKVDVKLPGKGNSNTHGTRPVHQNHLDEKVDPDQ